jgi:uncharacterized protein involved in exopolysaccharide biosynthesis
MYGVKGLLRKNRLTVREPYCIIVVLPKGGTGMELDMELMQLSLQEYREILKEEIRKLTLASNGEITALQSRLKELGEEEKRIKTKIKEIKDGSRNAQPEMLALARKLKAIDQILS